MIALYVFLVLLALVLFLLFVNIHIVFSYDQSAKVTVRVLFVQLDGMKLFQHFTGDKKADSKKKEQAKSQKNVPSTARKRKADPLGFAEFIVRIARVISLAVKEHFSKMKVYLKELCVLIGTEDAAKTALIYGSTIQAANALCVLLQRFSNFRCDNRHLTIAPDFTAEKSRFSIHLDLTVKAFHMIAVFLRAYFRLFESEDVDS